MHVSNSPLRDKHVTEALKLTAVPSNCVWPVGVFRIVDCKRLRMIKNVTRFLF